MMPETQSTQSQSQTTTHSSSSAAAADLQALARRGTLLAVTGQVGAQVTSLVVLGLLCRLVAPAQFGVYNTALLIVMLPRMFVTLGLSAASVQQPNLNDQQITAFFRLQILLGVAAAGLSALVGVALGWIWNAGDVGLVTVILAGSSIVLALGAQHQALLERKLRVATLLRLRLVAQASSGMVAIGLAWCGAGLWALIVQQYLELSIITLLSWSHEPWRPRRGIPAARLPNLLTSSGQAALALLCFHLAQNLDKLLLFLLIGSREGGEAVVGMYNLAFNLMMRPIFFVTTPVTGVMLPALSRAMEGQHRQYQSMALSFFRFVAVALFPCAAGLWLVAHDVTRVLAGAAWTEAGWLLAALAPTILAQGLINLCGSLLISANRYQQLAIGAGVVMLVQLQGHVSGAILGYLFLSGSEALPGLGVAQGMAAAYSTVLLFVVAIPYLRFAFGSVELPLSDLLRAVRPSLLATSSMTALVWATRHFLLPDSCPPALRLLASVLVGVAIYAFMARAEIRSALQLGSR